MKDTDRRDLQVRVRVSSNERRILEIMARREGRNWSEMLRQCIREAAEQRGMPAVGLVNVADLLKDQREPQ